MIDEEKLKRLEEIEKIYNLQDPAMFQDIRWLLTELREAWAHDKERGYKFFESGLRSAKMLDENNKLCEELAASKKDNEENLELLRKTSEQVCELWEELAEKTTALKRAAELIEGEWGPFDMKREREVHPQDAFIFDTIAKWDRTTKEVEE